MTGASRRVELICVDIDGTLTRGIGGPVIDGAVEALAALRARYQVRLVTNATSRLHAELAAGLRAGGLLEDPEALVTPVSTARRVLPACGHHAGLLLAEPAARSDYRWFEERADGPAVLLATEGHSLTIAELQPAFRALKQGATLYALQCNRYYRHGDELVTDLGAVAALLGYAAKCPVENLGKPSPLLFDALATDLAVGREATLMIGDDAEFDASGAVRLGMLGVLVRTGKYCRGDETRVEPPPTAVIDSIADLPAWLNQSRREDGG